MTNLKSLKQVMMIS